MKKFIKNTLLTFVIIYTILNLLFHVNIIILRTSMLNEVVPLLGEDRNVERSIELEEQSKEHIESRKEIYGENAPITTLLMFENYFMGMNQVLYGQEVIVIATLILSVAIAIILSLTEKSKIKAILYFILIGLVLAVLYTIYFHLTRNLPDSKFFDGFIENFMEIIGSYAIYYIAIYLLVYIGRYVIDKKKMKELNKEIEKKNK